MALYTPMEQRFWAKVRKSTGCWTWLGTTNNEGYGHIRAPRNGPLVKVHRYSWELHNGPIPNGMHVLHTCDNPSCVRPSHLFLGDHATNMKDRMDKGRTRNGNMGKTHCPQGHEYNAANTYTSKQGKRHCRVCGREYHQRKKVT